MDDIEVLDASASMVGFEGGVEMWFGVVDIVLGGFDPDDSARGGDEEILVGEVVETFEDSIGGVDRTTSTSILTVDAGGGGFEAVSDPAMESRVWRSLSISAWRSLLSFSQISNFHSSRWVRP